jgi:hypothetical protein
MAYTAPTTKTTGTLITAAIWNQDVANNQNAAFPLGVDAWTVWAPVITQNNTPTKTTAWAKYQRIGRTIFAVFDVTFTSAGTAANNIVATLPVTAAHAGAIVGSFRFFDTGTTNRAGTATGASTTTVQFIYDGFGNSMGNGDLVIANGDRLQMTVTYEAAT